MDLAAVHCDPDYSGLRRRRATSNDVVIIRALFLNIAVALMFGALKQMRRVDEIS